MSEEQKLKEEDIFKTKLSYSGNFDVKGLYNEIYKWFATNDWKDTQMEKKYYEKRYYERVTRDGKHFYEIKLSAKKNFNKQYKIDHYIDLKFLVVAYDPNKKSGDLTIEIKGYRKYPELSIQEIGFWKFIFEEKLKGEYKKVLKSSAKDLFKACSSLRDKILEYLKAYKYS